MFWQRITHCFVALSSFLLVMTALSTGQSQWATSGNNIYNTNSGNVGIGTTTPAVIFDAVSTSSNNDGFNMTQYANGAAIAMNLRRSLGTPAAPVAIDGVRTLGGFSFYGWDGSAFGISSQIQGIAVNAFNGSSHDGALAFYTIHGTTQIEAMRINNSQNIGIGTTLPGQKLEVNGNIKLSTGSNGTIIFPDGTTQTTAWAGAVCGGDYAESVQVSGGRSQYEPGDVLVIDPATPGGFKKSSERYSTMVAGIYSTKPGLTGRRYTTPDKAGAEVPMALVGIVPTKVNVENGPIKAGDLLVTSATPGYAMKGVDRGQMLGAVVGKALGSLDSGTGVIEVLVSLQ
jgi:hypothetical protein